MTISTKSSQTLSNGLEQLGINMDIEPLLQYLVLLEKWNKAFNLTAVRNIEEMVTRHLLDSLAILPWINGPRVIDVGSGAGLPGIPLALAQPDIQFVLLDCNGKKVRFMREAKRILELDNVDIVQSRVENFRPATGFDTVITRAFSELALLLSWTKHLLGQNGKCLAMKGRYPETELQAITLPWQVITYTVPGMDGERCCVFIENDQGTWHG